MNRVLIKTTAVKELMVCMRFQQFNQSNERTANELHSLERESYKDSKLSVGAVAVQGIRHRLETHQ